MSLTSILGNGCRSLSAPVALVRTLALTHVALSEHSSNYRHVKVAWFSQRSKKKRVACESLKEEITHPIVASSVYGYPYTRLLPCPSQNGPPRVEHLVVSEGGPVLEYICKNLDLPAQSHPFWSCVLCTGMSTASSNGNPRANEGI